MRKEKDRSYEVGYGKPPRRNQFKKVDREIRRAGRVTLRTLPRWLARRSTQKWRS